MTKRSGLFLVLAGVAVLCVAGLTRAQQSQISPDVYNEMKFRYIGPVGNRATAVAGIPGNPNVYYVGAASGGIFKSTDGGIHWDPIFDDEPVAGYCRERPEYRVGGDGRVVYSKPHFCWQRDL